MRTPPAPEGKYVPTPEELESARYVVGWGDGKLAGEIVQQYAQRTTSVGDDHLMIHLEREGFFAGTTPLMDVGCGPSPHVGYHFGQRVRDRELFFLDASHTALTIHRLTYRHIQQAEQAPERGLREYWMLGDALDEPYLLSHKAVIVHGSLPSFQTGAHTLRHDAPELLRVTLDGLLSAQPERLALYLNGDHEPHCPESPARVLATLDALGARYRVVEGVASADFTPRGDGYLVLLTP